MNFQCVLFCAEILMKIFFIRYHVFSQLNCRFGLMAKSVFVLGFFY